MTSTAPLERAVVYRLVSVGFGPPDEAGLLYLQELTRAAASRAGDEGLVEALVELACILDAVELPALEAAYHDLFGGTVEIPPYEGSFERDPIRSSRELADVAGFYRAFGADTGGPAAERPDHVGCELEFLSFLVLKALSAERDGRHEDRETCLEAEEAFLRDHVGRWVPAFCREVAQTSEEPAYRLLGIVGERALTGELARRGLRAATPGARARTAVEGDEVSCGGEAAPLATEPLV